jgi:hypothetical protein
MPAFDEENHTIDEHEVPNKKRVAGATHDIVGITLRVMTTCNENVLYAVVAR